MMAACIHLSDAKRKETNATSEDMLAERRYNATELLDRLLQGYDRRLHPGFGGETRSGGKHVEKYSANKTS